MCFRTEARKWSKFGMKLPGSGRSKGDTGKLLACRRELHYILTRNDQDGALSKGSGELRLAKSSGAGFQDLSGACAFKTDAPAPDCFEEARNS